MEQGFTSPLPTHGPPLAMLSAPVSLSPCPAYLRLTFPVSGYVLVGQTLVPLQPPLAGSVSGDVLHNLFLSYKEVILIFP